LTIVRCINNVQKFYLFFQSGQPGVSRGCPPQVHRVARFNQDRRPRILDELLRLSILRTLLVAELRKLSRDGPLRSGNIPTRSETEVAALAAEYGNDVLDCRADVGWVPRAYGMEMTGREEGCDW